MKFMRSIILLVPILLLARPLPAAPQIPGAAQSRPIALVGGTIHPVAAPDIANGTIVFDGGKITALGKHPPIPDGAEIIDVSGRHIYPGLFDTFSNLGLSEIDAVRATHDSAETGRINPNVKAWVAVNPDSELIPVTRSNGVLLMLTAPTGGLLSGRSGVLQLDGWTYADLTLQSDVGLHIQWPSMAPVLAAAAGKPDKDKTEKRAEALDELRRFFADARAYQKARAAGDQQAFDARLDAMLPVFDGKLPLIVTADEIQQIQAAVAFAVEHRVKLIIYGGYDAPHCAELLKQHDVPVIIAGVYRLPLRRSDDYDDPFTLPERLREAGVRFCISGAGRFGASNARNLPYHAAMAAAYGLARDEALKAITLYPAQILGVADRVGSLAVGRDATLFISDGDPLETFTHVEAAYIQGRPVDLSNRHTQLWQKYQEKYRRQNIVP